MNTGKVLFAYDGSACANDALEDLQRAGFPSELDLMGVSVAEVWVLEDDEEEKEQLELSGPTVAHGIIMSERAKAGLDRARIFARHAAHMIRERFPAWTVDTSVYPDSPAWGVLHAAEKWNPDMIVLGSQGRSALSRFFLGSVSQKVLAEAKCSVRIARHRAMVNGAPVRLLAGLDGTPDSDAVVDAIASRNWPAGSSVKLLSAVGPVGVFVDPVFAYDVIQWEGAARQWERMEQVTSEAAARLREAGLLVDTTVRDGAPGQLLLDEAEELGADCIFVGARGHRFWERFLIGSVSSAVAARSGCSVEVVRTVKVAGESAGQKNVS
ncbi:MAG: universal stress protein [Bacteroidota bacterium]